MVGFVVAEWGVVGGVVCRMIVCKSRECEWVKGREGIKVMGKKFFDIHESSSFNMTFKCSGQFTIIYNFLLYPSDAVDYFECLELVGYCLVI